MPRVSIVVSAVLLASGLPAGAQAQSSKVTTGVMSTSTTASTEVTDFYRGNTVYMIVGSAAGGGFDYYARVISRFMTKYVPGNPTFVAQNMPGAGGITAGTRVAVTAPQDGTFVGAIHPSTIVAPVLGEKSLKPLKLAYLGSASVNVEGCFLRTDAPAKSLADGFKTEIVMGASNQGSSSREYASLLRNVLGLNIKIVGGYTGSNDIMLALERGEVQATCGASVLNVVASRPNWFKDNIVRVASHQGPKELPEMKELQGAKPTVFLAKTDEQRAILNLFDLQGPIGRPYATGADVPPDRVKALRAAFAASMSDPELRKEVESKGLEVSPLSGDEVQAIAGKILNAPADLIKKTRAALGYD